VYAGVSGGNASEIAALGSASIAGSLNVNGSAILNGPTFLTNRLDVEKGAITISNSTANFAYLELRAGTPAEIAIVPTFTFTANADDPAEPQLTLTRTNMSDFPVQDSVMLTALPNQTVEFPNTLNVNGAITSTFTGDVLSAGTDAVNILTRTYFQYPINILAANSANGYINIVLQDQPSVGSFICIIYDDNAQGSGFVQTVNILDPDSVTVLGTVTTNGKQKAELLVGNFTLGSPLSLFTIKSDITGITSFDIPTSSATALHAATQQAKGFTFKKQA
jgi:hypothetical protein